MAKKEKKVDVKAVEKERVSKILRESATVKGLEILDGEAFGFTKGSFVVRTAVCDIQVKIISPKAGVTRYSEVEETEEGA